MILRSLATLIGVVCTATLITEGLVLLALWQRGYLSPENVREIQLTLFGEAAIPAESAGNADPPPTPTQAEVQQARVLRILQLENREQELALLKADALEAANQFISERAALDEMKTSFSTELKTIEDRVRDTATRQARAVLMVTPPADAVDRLMGLSWEENVAILKGMPEKNISKILAEFRGPDEKLKRGQALFEALSRGEPERTLTTKTQQDLASQSGKPASTTN